MSWTHAIREPYLYYYVPLHKHSSSSSAGTTASSSSCSTTTTKISSIAKDNLFTSSSGESFQSAKEYVPRKLSYFSNERGEYVVGLDEYNRYCDPRLQCLVIRNNLVDVRSYGKRYSLFLPYGCTRLTTDREKRQVEATFPNQEKLILSTDEDNFSATNP